MKLSPAVKQLWLAALRSGDYVQGRGALRSVHRGGKSTYCCLGVLCDVAEREGVVDFDDAENYVARGDRSDHASGSLPLAVVRWAGLGENLSTYQLTRDPKVTFDDRRWELSELNDDVRLTFAEIADIIEEQL